MEVEVQLTEGAFYSKTIEMPALPPEGSLMIFELDNDECVELKVTRVVWRNNPCDGYEVWCGFENGFSCEYIDRVHDDLLRNGWKVIE